MQLFNPRDPGDGDETALELLDARLRSDPRIQLEAEHLHISLEDGTLLLEGDVPSLPVKRRIVNHARSLPGIALIADELHVLPASAMSDAEIRDHVVAQLRQDSTFAESTIEVKVQNGVVILTGAVPSRAHERLALVIAWWVPGTRDVVDGLVVKAPEADDDSEITDAVRIGLEKDPLLDAAQIGINTRRGVVSLMGEVASAAEKDMAEFDAFSVLGVRDVDNAILVRQPE